MANVHVQNERWVVTSTDFATRITIPDLDGYFRNLPLISSFPKAKTLVIEPGTRAFVIEDDLLAGELPPGAYTLESFVERLQFWRSKQSTVVLARQEDVPLEDAVAGILSLEGVGVDLRYRWTVQISDILLFLTNLFGARTALSIPELDGLLQPLVRQAVYGIVGATGYDQIRDSQFAAQLADALRSQLDVRLQRYGLRFVDLQSVAVTCDDAGLRERHGEAWLGWRENQLQRALHHVENDQLAARLEDYQQKVAVRKQLRDVVASDRLNQAQSKEDFAAAIFALDKQQLLRQEERDSLTQAYEERKEDQAQQRAHLLATIDLQRERELEELRIELDHALRQKSLLQELELTRLTQTREAEQWRHELNREREAATHRRDEKRVALQARWERLRDARQQQRSDQWEAVLHEQKLEEVRLDLELKKAERARQVALIQAELESRLAAEKYELHQRQQEWEAAQREKQSHNQLERLQQVQNMNLQFAERQQRMQAELEKLKADGEHQREIERLQAMSTLSSDALIATAAMGNASLLADLKKTELVKDGNDGGAAQQAEKLNEERQRLYERLNETERAKADAIAEAYKLAMQAQHASVSQMIGGLAQAVAPPAGGLSPFTPAGMAPPGPPPLTPAAATWYVSLNGQQSPPLPLAQLHQYIQSGQVQAATLVWRAGLPAWLPAGQVAELVPYFGSSGGPPPLPAGADAKPS
ncbi:MAG: GYF domain-containing protein [Pirellulales bacterium]